MPYSSDDWGQDDYSAVDFPDYNYNDNYGYDGYDYGNFDSGNDGLSSFGGDNSGDVPFMGSTFEGPDAGTGDITQGNYDNYDWSQGANPNYNLNSGTGQVEYNPDASPTYGPNDTYTDLAGNQWLMQQDGTYKDLNSGDMYDPVNGDYYTANEWYNNNLTAANPTAVDLSMEPWWTGKNDDLGMPQNSKGFGQNTGTASPSGGSSGGATAAGSNVAKPADTSANNSLVNALLGALGKAVGAITTPTTPTAKTGNTQVVPTGQTKMVGTAQAGLTGLTGAKQVANQAAKELEAIATPRNLAIGAVIIGGLLFFSRRKRNNYSNGRSN